MDIPSEKAASDSNQELARRIEKSEYDDKENNREIYNAENGMRISIKDQEGADTMTGWLREADKNEAQFQHENEIQINKLANEGMTSTSVSPEMTEALRSQDAIAAEIKAAEARHQEALDSNKKAYSGMTSTGISSEMANALASQDEIAKKAKADAVHQEALNSNEKANEGFTSGMTQTGRNALNAQDTIAELAKENAKLKEPQVTTPSTPERDLHQEALDKNTKANEGFTGSLTQTGRNALRSQDTIAELAKENAALKEEKELTPEQKELKEIKILIKEQSVQIQQLILIMQQNITNINGTSTTSPAEVTPTAVTELTPEQKEIIDIKAAVSLQSEQINKLIIMMQQNNINVQNGNGTPIPTEATSTTATTEQTPVTQEATPTPEARRKLKVAYIAGAVIGGSTGILGGVPAAGIGALACIAGGLLNTGLTKLSESNITRWNRRLETVTDPAERTKLEKRVANWTKVNNFCQTSVKDFLRGARHGLLASSIFSGVFLGGHGLAWNTPEAISPISNPAGGNQGNPVGTGGTETGAGSNPETYQGNDFIDKNGQIHANGSPWDSKYVAGPEGHLPGGAENATNYVEGPWGRTPSVVDNFLKQNNVTDTSFLDGYDRDRILDETWLAIKNGNVNPDMTEILKHINTEGTNKLLSTIGQ